MRLLPREKAKLELHQAGLLAQRRLARGVRLNATEATALIATVLHELIRDGRHSVAELMAIGKTILGKRHVLPSVPAMMIEIMVEGTFKSGTFLVTVHEPISSETVQSLELALYGSFLPLPESNLFPSVDHESPRDEPGCIQPLLDAPPIAINPNRERIKIKVTNMGDRPIQVGSHYHFVETNRHLAFDRAKAFFKKLDIASGTAVRFEPGESKTVTLCSIGGRQIVHGGNNLTSSSSLTYRSTDSEREVAASVLASKGFSHTPQPDATSVSEPYTIGRESYAKMYGPTTGDRIRLADTNLWIMVEKDLTTYGEELKFGGGKTVRENMGQAGGVKDDEALDMVITNCLIVDWSGIYKADIGIKKGYISGIGKAGNPDTQDGVTPGMVVGVTTEVAAGEGLIVTAGALDVHVHFIGPHICEEALSSGITTLVGGGTGPTAGTGATTCTPSQRDFHRLFAATDGIPMNIALTGKGNDSEPDGLIDMIKAGAAGLKLHEDWGCTPAAIDNCLSVAEKYDIQVNIHTDTLNESGYVEDTIAAFKDRTIHTYHTEGAGGGHAPDIIRVCSLPNVLPSSTNPTRPFTADTLDEHLDMLMVCHHLDKTIPEDIAFAESRIRAETVAAEDVLQDSGAISVISSDSQAMGRVGEVISRTWRTAAKMKLFKGPLASEKSDCDNERVKRYISKYTINPAIIHGIDHVVGDVAVGKLADLVLWRPDSFGVKPRQVLKGGSFVYADIGDANGSIPTVEPINLKPMWSAEAAAAAMDSVLFVSQLSIDTGIIAGYGLKKEAKAVRGCRKVKKTDLKHNTAMPEITVDPESYKVTADGEHCWVDPAKELPMTQSYMLF